MIFVLAKECAKVSSVEDKRKENIHRWLAYYDYLDLVPILKNEAVKGNHSYRFRTDLRTGKYLCEILKENGFRAWTDWTFEGYVEFDLVRINW